MRESQIVAGGSDILGKPMSSNGCLSAVMMMMMTLDILLFFITCIFSIEKRAELMQLLVVLDLDSPPIDFVQPQPLLICVLISSRDKRAKPRKQK